MRQLLPRRLKLTRLTGMYSFLFLNLLLLGRPACFHLTHPITLAIPVQVSQEKRRAALTRKWRPLLWELNFKRISHVQFKNKKCQCTGGESHKEGPKKKKIVVIKKIKAKKGKDQVPKAARPTTEGSQEKDQDMQPTEQDMQPKTPGGDQDKNDHDLLSKGTERSMDTQDTMPYEPYEGAYSQWREEDETNWDKYQWPPVGWRPSKWNQCYWDNTSKWHVYHSDDWDAYNAQRTPWEDGPNSPDVSTPAKTSVESDTTSPPATVSSSGGSLSRSDSVEALANQLGRAWTGDLVDPLSQDPAVAGDKSTGPNLGVNNGQESEVQKHPGQGENEGKKDEGKEEKAEKARAGEHEDKQSEEKPKEVDNKENAKEGEKEGDNGEKAKEGENGDGEKRKEGDKEEAMKVESNQEQPGDSGGAPAQEAEDEAERARLEEIEERRKAAHARYMRYFRNVRSINLSLSRWSSQYMWITCTYS